MYNAKTSTGAKAMISFCAVISVVLLTTIICIANNTADSITGKYLNLAKPHPISHPIVNRNEKM
jgi:hypothetical protein